MEAEKTTTVMQVPAHLRKNLPIPPANIKRFNPYLGGFPPSPLRKGTVNLPLTY
jgi:hypothetical protein